MALAFGIISLALAFLAELIAGWVGFAVVALFAVLAIVFTVMQNKKAEEGVPKKKAGIVLGVIGIVIGLLFSAMVSYLGGLMRDKAKELDCNMVVEVSEGFANLGIIGMGLKASELGYDTPEKKAELERQMDLIKDSISDSNSSGK